MGASGKRSPRKRKEDALRISAGERRELRALRVHDEDIGQASPAPVAAGRVATDRRVRWHRADDGFVRSRCGHWRIVPLYCGSTRPQMYDLHRDDRSISGSGWHGTQREAREEADRIVAAERAGSGISPPARPAAGSKRTGGARVSDVDPCACGHSPEEHGHDPDHPSSAHCTECDCIAYEADPV